jgi:hypothetical protein
MGDRQTDRRQTKIENPFLVISSRQQLLGGVWMKNGELWPILVGA